MSRCRYCHKPFKVGLFHGRPTTGCPDCRKRRAARKHLIIYGVAVAHDEGNGRRPAPTCPVCSEPRAVMKLCRCERLLELGAMTPEDIDRDYASRYGAG